MKVLEKYGDRPFKFYLGEKFDVIIFSDYKWGESSTLIRYKQYNKFNGSFVETIGGMGYGSTSKDNVESAYKLTNIFEEHIQDVEIYLINEKLFISASSTQFEFITETNYTNQLDGATLLELPKRRVIQYICQFKDEIDKYIIIDKDEFDHSARQNFYYGTIDDYEDVDITDYLRYRDGGTVVITTLLGEFISPSPLKNKRKTIWTDKEGEVFELNEIEGYYSHNTKMFLEKLNIKETKLKK